MKRKDITGQRFNHLVAVKPISTDKFGQVLWLCKCDCGNEYTTTVNRLTQGKTKSCGCANKGIHIKHGLSNSRINKIYFKMKGRCYTKTDRAYKDYGGRGITICDEWLGEKGFENFYKWSMANGYTDDLSIDRIDNNKGYSPDNCRWADEKTQCRNRRTNHLITFNGETKSMAEWSEITRIPYSAIRRRIKLGWKVEDILTREVKEYGKI